MNKPVGFNVEVPYEKVPPSHPVKGVRYAYIRAVSQTPSLFFNKVVRVVLSSKSLSVFVQTDKPVYKRNENGVCGINTIFCFQFQFTFVFLRSSH